MSENPLGIAAKIKDGVPLRRRNFPDLSGMNRDTVTVPSRSPIIRGCRARSNGLGAWIEMRSPALFEMVMVSGNIPGTSLIL
jgi:hypothetical protein